MDGLGDSTELSRVGLSQAGADSSAGGAASSPATSAAGSSPSQDKSVDFLQSTQAGCQSSTTTTSNVLLGKNQHLQARPDHRHGWGAEDTSNVDQSRLGRRLLLCQQPLSPQ
jgi:hypothetical protein